MKKLFVISLILLSAFLLFSCDDDSDEYRVDIFIYQFADTYITSVRNRLETELNGIENVVYTFHDAAEQQELQLSQIDAAIAAGSDLLVVNIVETESGDVIVRRAQNANLPIIFFNREVSDSVINSYDRAAFIGTDPDEAGYLQGELIYELLTAEGAYEKYDLNGDGVINYVMLRADLDNPEANGRTTYSVYEANRLLTAAGYPQLNQLGSDVVASWDSQLAKAAMDTLLASYPFDSDNPIELVIANNDDMALGAIQSLNLVGYNTGTDDKSILVVGVDATTVAQDAILSGKMGGSVKQDSDAMAVAIAKFIENASLGNDYLFGTDYEYEDGSRKLRIPYSKFVA